LVKLGGDFALFQHGVISLFSFGGRDATDGFQKTSMIKPVPFQSCKLDGLKRSPWPTAMDHLGLVKTVDGFGQGVDAPILVKGYRATVSRASAAGRDIRRSRGPGSQRGAWIRHWRSERSSVGERPLSDFGICAVPFKLNQHRRHHIPRRQHKVTNWPAYEAGLRQRGSLTVWFTDEAVATWAAAPRTTRGGQPFYSPLAILTALTLRAVFRLAYRQAEGLIVRLSTCLA
jgi:hypothetical protein